MLVQGVHRARRKSRRAWDPPSWGVSEEHLRHLTSWRDVPDMVAALEPSDVRPFASASGRFASAYSARHTATTLRCAWREAPARTKESTMGWLGKERFDWRNWPLEPLRRARGANAAAVGIFRVWEVVELDWDIGLGDWVGGSLVASEFVTRPEKKTQAQKKVHTHILQGCCSLKAVDFSVASKKKGLPLFPNLQSFFLLLNPNVSFPTSNVLFPIFTVFSSTGALFF